MSATTTVSRTDQNSGVLALPLCIFFTQLAVDAVPRVRKRIETLVGDVEPAVVALAERFGRAVETAQRLVEVPQETTLLAREQERLLAFHRVRALVGHVERVRAQVPIGTLGR